MGRCAEPMAMIAAAKFAAQEPKSNEVVDFRYV
jgi:hypothetical protein